MRLKLGEIVDMYTGLNKFGNKEMPIQCSLIILNDITELDPKVKMYESKRSELVTKYSEKDENGDPIQENGMIKLSDEKKFMKEFTEMINTEFDVNLEKIHTDWLQGILVTPAELVGIKKLIEE